jgi:hypothetical protein
MCQCQKQFPLPIWPMVTKLLWAGVLRAQAARPKTSATFCRANLPLAPAFSNQRSALGYDPQGFWST